MSKRGADNSKGPISLYYLVLAMGPLNEIVPVDASQRGSRGTELVDLTGHTAISFAAPAVATPTVAPPAPEAPRQPAFTFMSARRPTAPARQRVASTGGVGL